MARERRWVFKKKKDGPDFMLETPHITLERIDRYVQGRLFSLHPMSALP